MKLTVVHRARRIDARRERLGVRHGQQPLHRDLGKGRIADMPVTFHICELAGLDLQVESLCRQRIVDGLAEAEHVEQQQGGQALAGRRALPHPHAAISGGDRRRIVAAMPGEIVGVMQAALGAQAAHHVGGDPAAVKRISSAARDRRQGLGEGGKSDAITGQRRLAFGQHRGTGRRIAAQPVRIARPIAGDARCDDEAVLGQLDRRL
jgi:hypothetical protein